MTLGIRKLVVLGLITGVFLLANVMFVAHWLTEMGIVDWAVKIRKEFLTGTAITIIVVLLILIVAFYLLHQLIRAFRHGWRPGRTPPQDAAGGRRDGHRRVHCRARRRDR